MDSSESEIVGWIFRCDLCGFDDKVMSPNREVCIETAQALGWVIDIEGKCRCPKCIADLPKPPAPLSFGGRA